MPATACPACLSPETFVSESLETASIAARWSLGKFHGPDATPELIRRYVREDLGSESIEIVSCRVCGLEFACPARTWSASHYPHEQHELGWDHEQALAELEKMPPLRLLDVGCANGQFLARAAALGHTVTGVDFSPEDIEAATSQGFEAYVADLSKKNALVDADRRFDAITLFQVIEHLEAPDLVFDQLTRLAAPGAHLMLGCPSSRRYTRKFMHPDRIGSSDFWDCPPQHSLRWTPAALEAFTARHGFAIRHVIFEPVDPVHAAAHLAGLSQYSSNFTRRAAILAYRLRLRLSSATGIRLYFRAVKLSGGRPG